MKAYVIEENDGMAQGLREVRNALGKILSESYLYQPETLAEEIRQRVLKPLNGLLEAKNDNG